MVFRQKFRDQTGPFFISLAEDLCLALPIPGERRQAISPLRPRRACSCPAIISRPNIHFQRRSFDESSSIAQAELKSAQARQSSPSHAIIDLRRFEIVITMKLLER